MHLQLSQGPFQHELELVQPIYVQKITIFGHVGWLAIADVDIFRQNVLGFLCT